MACSPTGPSQFSGSNTASGRLVLNYLVILIIPATLWTADGNQESDGAE